MGSRRRFSQSLASLALAMGVLVSGCGGSQQQAERPRRIAPRPTGDSQEPKVVGPTALEATLVSEVPAGTFGPYLGLRSKAGVAVWAEVSSEGEERSWMSIGLDGQGAPSSKAKKLAAAPAEPGLVVVRPLGGTTPHSKLDPEGFAVLATERTAAGDSVLLLSLSGAGALVSGPITLARVNEQVLWVEAVATKRGAVALWAVKRGDRADIFAADLAEPSTETTTQAVATDVRAWQAVEVDGRIALGVVRAGESNKSGPIEVLFIDENAKAVGAATKVSDTRRADLDLDLAWTSAGLFVAWSDRSGLEAKIMLATVGANGKLAKPAAAVLPPMGEQALLRLVAPLTPTGPAFIVWEDATGDPAARQLRIARLEADGKPGPERARITVGGDGSVLPEFQASPRGLAALTLSPACSTKKADCSAEPVVRTFVELSPKLEVLASEPIRPKPALGQAAALAWALSCRNDGCLALAAAGGAPAAVYTVQLEHRSGEWQPAAGRDEAQAPPFLQGNEALELTEPLADMAAVGYDDRDLVAWVTDFDSTTPYTRRKTPAPDGRFDPLRARLKVRAFPRKGNPRQPHIISYRARSLGGVALSAGDPARRETLLVWTAIDNGQPQVFTTLLGEDGQKLALRMLTRSKGEALDVTAEYVGDGWIIGWIDERDGDPEVYVTKIDRRLLRVAPERRLTKLPGSASDVTLLRRGDQVLVAWADANGSSKEGFGDIQIAAVKAKNAEIVKQPTRVGATELHSRAPRLAAFGDKALLGWIDEQPGLGAGAQTAPGSGLMLVPVAANGTPESSAVRPVVGLEGRATDFAAQCQAQGCRVIASVAVGEGSALRGVYWQPSRKPTIVALTKLAGPMVQQTVPRLLGERLYVADQPRQGQGQLRRLRVGWP